MNHTSTPWHVSRIYENRISGNGSRSAIAVCPTQSKSGFLQAATDAKYIVLCVNNHDALVEALKLLVYGVENNRIPQINGGLISAKAALAKAAPSPLNTKE